MAALDWQGWLTIAVVVATLGMLLWERYTPDKVLVGAAAVLMASGVLGPKEALAGFWNPGVLTVAVLFVLVAALKSTGAIRWVGGWILGRPNGEWRARARLVGITALPVAAIGGRPDVILEAFVRTEVVIFSPTQQPHSAAELNHRGRDPR